ncbi:PIN domain-containing protein [Candidatus Woesebacteria bacterium]|nr:PIN domain-containing protein [Candidatus Woesebacteria bacterium]
MKVYFDSDCIISSIISQKGAAYLLRERVKNKQIHGYISSISVCEVTKAIPILNLSTQATQYALGEFEMIQLSSTALSYGKKYVDYVSDVYDGHVVAGAIDAKARFLVTYNAKHFQIERLKRDHNIILLSPGMMVQYLRSQE